RVAADEVRGERQPRLERLRPAHRRLGVDGEVAGGRLAAGTARDVDRAGDDAGLAHEHERLLAEAHLDVRRTAVLGRGTFAAGRERAYDGGGDAVARAALVEVVVAL